MLRNHGLPSGMPIRIPSFGGFNQIRSLPMTPSLYHDPGTEDLENIIQEAPPAYGSREPQRKKRKFVQEQGGGGISEAELVLSELSREEFEELKRRALMKKGQGGGAVLGRNLYTAGPEVEEALPVSRGLTDVGMRLGQFQGVRPQFLKSESEFQESEALSRSTPRIIPSPVAPNAIPGVPSKPAPVLPITGRIPGVYPQFTLGFQPRGVDIITKPILGRLIVGRIPGETGPTEAPPGPERKFAHCETRVRVFPYEPAKTGIIHFLGLTKVDNQWRNPVEVKQLRVCASSLAGGSLATCVDQSGTGLLYQSEDLPYSWVVFDLGERSVRLTHYQLGHFSPVNGFYLRSWNLEASLNNKDWTLISRHDNDESLNQNCRLASWAVSSAEFVRYIRIVIDKDGNSEGTSQLIFNHFEMFGEVKSPVVQRV